MHAPREIFDRLLERKSDYLVSGNRCIAAGKKGISPFVKVTAALRMLCYAAPAGSLEEAYQIGESTALMSLKDFCRAVVAAFDKDYLSTPKGVDIIRIEQQFAEVVFPGCVGCVDCSKWELCACPKAEHGITVGKDQALSLKMELVCDLDIRVWSLFCGLPGMLNDLNVLDLSPFFARVMNDTYPIVLPTYTVGGKHLI